MGCTFQVCTMEHCKTDGTWNAAIAFSLTSVSAEQEAALNIPDATAEMDEINDTNSKHIFQIKMRIMVHAAEKKEKKKRTQNFSYGARLLVTDLADSITCGTLLREKG